MERIDVSKLLKECPSGMKLDSTMYENIVFDKIIEDDKIFPIRVIRSEDGFRMSLTKYGQYSDIGSAKCIIFPEGKTTWEGFHRPFKDGDIIYVRDEYSDETFTYVAILKQIEKGGEINTHCFYNYEDDEFSTHDFLYDGYNIRFATEEEKEKLFKVIKDNGYKWNPESKTLEKLIKPKFKVGDKIKHKDTVLTIITVQTNSYIVEDLPDNFGILLFSQQDKWELINEPKFKVGDKIKLKGGDEFGIITEVADCFYTIKNKNNTHCWPIKKQDDWELVTNKFKPFDKVLMRSSNAREWVATFYSHYSNNKFYGCGMCCDQCIPYEGNEHLLGKTDDCDEYFKNLIS